jgi:spore coat polysaccharide biosynthesis protein SpsF
MIGAIIQARTSSTRLPAKVLLELPYGSGITVLQQVIRRLKQSKKIDTIVVATTEDKADDAIVDIASCEGVSSFRGSKENVLERYYLAAKNFGLDTIVRITSDCPCIDASAVDATIGHYYAENADYSSILAARTFLHGLDNEVFSFAVLEMAYKNATKDYEKEHVTPYIYKTNPDKFKISFLDAFGDLRRPDIRVTLDTEEDYILLCAVFDYLYGVNQFFDAVQIVNLFDQKPWLTLISRKVIQKKVLDSLEDEVAEALRVLEFQDLGRVKDLLVEYVSKNESGHPNRSW